MKGERRLGDEVKGITDACEMSFLNVSVPEVITDATKESGPMRLRFKATKANVLNDNGRIYPLKVLEPAIAISDSKYAKAGQMIGESPHPKACKSINGQIVFDSKLENSVIKIDNVFMKGTEAFLDATVLDTAKGKDLKALVDAKVPVGISMRALGTSVAKNLNGKNVSVATFLDIKTFDVVMNPATEGCGVVEVLTDSQMKEILNEPIKDGIQPTTPTCPACNGTLTPQDPDGDGDIDFYVCNAGCGVFIADQYLSQTTNASMELRRVSDTDWDRFDLARQYIAAQKAAKTATTDSILKGDVEMKFEELIKDPEFASAVSAIAKQTAQPALDAVEAAKQAEEARKASETAKSEAKTFIDSKVGELTGKMDEKAIKVISDAVNSVEIANKEQAQIVFDAALKVVSDSTAAQLLAGVGMTASTTKSPEGLTTIEVKEGKPWQPFVDKIVMAFDDYGMQFGKIPDQSIRKYNQKFVDKLIGRFEEVKGPKVLADSVQGFEALSDSISVSTQQLLNQPTIFTAVLVQAFQDVEALQFLMADTFAGSEWKLPVETYQSAETFNSATGLMDILVPEGNGIPESAISLTWQNYQPDWRRNAVSLTTDVVNQLGDGPAKYEAIARAIYHIGADKGRKLDNAAYYEMILASDEYAPILVTNEAVAADHLIAVSNGTNVAYKALLNVKGAFEASKGYNPIVRPRTKKTLQPSGQVAITVVNPFTVTATGFSPVMGYLDSNGNIQPSGANYAVDWENGIIYFKTGSGVDATHLPTVSYSAVSNYDKWSITVPNGMDAAVYYNTLLQKLTQNVALMGSAPRYKKPNIGLMSLNAATYIENAQLFYKLASPEGTKLIPTSNTFGERSGVNLSKINAPWIVGDGRILLTTKGSTRYGVETPYQIEGPYPKYDTTNGNIIDAKVWYGRENSVLCTPQTTDASGNVINPVSRTIKLVP